MFSDATVAVPNIQAGKVVALGTSAAKADGARRQRVSDRSHSSGLRLAGVAGDRGAGRHAEGHRRPLIAELQKIQVTPEFREQLVKFGMDPFPPQTPEQFAAMIAAEQPRWAKAVKDSGAKVD